MGKSATKASAQQKRKATHSQHSSGKRQNAGGSKAGGKGSGKKQPRKAAAQVVGGKGAMYNLA